MFSTRTVKSLSKTSFLTNKRWFTLEKTLFSDTAEANYRPKKESTDGWKKQSPDIFSSDKLVIDGCHVMERWENSLMKQHANIVCINGGKILELGFGLALSATAIQQNDIQEHNMNYFFNEDLYYQK